MLRLKYRGNELVRRRDSDVGRRSAATRTAGCRSLTTRPRATTAPSSGASDKFVLKDHSTNGTYVTLEGDSELLLRREELVLRKNGWISFGQSRAGTQEVVEFFIG